MKYINDVERYYENHFYENHSLYTLFSLSVWLSSNLYLSHQNYIYKKIN